MNAHTVFHDRPDLAITGTTPRTVGALALAACLLTAPVSARGQDTDTAAPAPGLPPAHVHLRHVSETFRGTPDRRGLLPTAIAEAEIARQHAELAGRAPSDLEAMQRHAGHVIHALDPQEVENGPGMGYGMIVAARRAAHYTELAMASVGGGDAVQTHGPHVATAARSAATMAEEAVELADDIVDADTAEEAAELLARLVELTGAIVDGVDADGDGRVSWQEGEGGLAQADQHLGLLLRGEGLAG